MWFKLANVTFPDGKHLGSMSDLSNSVTINYSSITGFTANKYSVSKTASTETLTLTLKSNYTYTHSDSNVTISGGAIKNGASTFSGSTLTIPIKTSSGTFASTINVTVTGAVINSTPSEPGEDTALDSIAYGGKTYREIFENGNKITTGNMITNSSLDDWTQFNTTPRVTVTTAQYNTPSSAVDATCTASAQVYKAIPGGLISDHKYYMACKRKLTAYTKGSWCGFQVSDASRGDSIIAGKDICSTFAISNEFITISKIYSISTTYDNVRFWVGCGGSAQLTAYIDDYMLIDLTEIFGSNIPSEEEMNILYDKFLVMHGATVDKPTSLDDIAYDNISYRTLFLNNNELNDMNMIDNTTINLTQYQDFPLPVIDNNVYNTPSVSLNVSGTRSTQGYKECDVSTNHSYFIGFNRNITAKTAGSNVGIWFSEDPLSSGFSPAGGVAVTDGWEARSSIYTYTGTKTKGLIWVGSGGGANLSGHIDDLVFVDLTKVFGDNIPTSNKMRQLYDNFVELCKNN